MAVTTERMATGDPPGRQVESPRDPVDFDGLGRIRGAGRRVAARRWLQPAVLPVPIECPQHHPANHRRSATVGRPVDQARHVISKCRVGDSRGGSIVDTKQVEAGRELDLLGEDGPEAPSDPVAHHRIPDVLPDCIPNMG